MALTVNAKTYANDVARTPDIMRYLGPAHTLTTNDYIDLARVTPKATPSYSGKARARLKLTRTTVDALFGSNLGDVIAEINISTPVGSSEASMDAILADLSSYLATASAESLFQDLKVVQ